MHKFWLDTPITEMTEQQWEALCDGCGKCCLHKIFDDEAPLMYHTRVACEYLDLKTCQCQVYDQRQVKVPDCTKVSADNVDDFNWLPETCGYRLVAAGEDLPAWHPLQTGDVKSPIKAGMTVKKWAVSERKVAPDNWGEYIIEIQQLDADE